MNKEENKEQYKILAKDDNLNQYEIIMSLQENKNIINFMIEPDETHDCKYKGEFDITSLIESHAFFKNRVKNIKDAYNEIIILIESNKEKGAENKVNFEQNLFLIIPYQPMFSDFIKFELKKERLNTKDKLDIFSKMIKDLKDQINIMNEKIKKLENNVKICNKEGKLIFDGEYKNGLKYKGKEYNDEGKLIFDGEYKNGEPFNGIMKQYKNGKLLSDGEYKNGLFWNITYYEFDGTKNRKIINGNGNGKEYGGDKIKFDGEYKDGKRYKV